MAVPLPVPEPKQQRSVATRRRLLDAAVAELIDNGYGAVTTVGVARRAGATRGAQQHHFPNRELLVAEAIKHLANLTSEQLTTRIAELPKGKSRMADALDLVYEQYAGPLFVAMFELSLAARHEPALQEIVAAEEAAMAGTVYGIGGEILGADALRSADTAARWTAALSQIRGIAILRVLGHSEGALQRQWRFARSQIIASLTAQR
ncbi:MAG: hypothetical protein QOF76_276 [Solirubrobacteraceae bacterium]|jgi:AcrR family transcriptional regulator|nr:hypothetical protein [Solirubrobacteraceae bacterium]